MKPEYFSSLGDALSAGVKLRNQEYQAEATRYALAKQFPTTAHNSNLRAWLGLKLMQVGLRLIGRLERRTATSLLAQIQARSLEQSQIVYIKQAQ